MKKHSLHTIISALLMVTAVFANAQTDAETCPRAVEESASLVRVACAELADGQACVGSGLVSATATFGIDELRFANPGDRASLSDIQRIQTRSMTADSRAWTTVTARLQSTTVEGAPTVVHMLVLGDAAVWQADRAPETEVQDARLRPATISAETGLIVRGNASEAAESVWQLSDGEVVSAIGRSGDEQWIRILLPSPNGGAGWVLGRYITVEGGSETLPVHINASPIPTPESQPEISPKGYPSYRMESSLFSEDCPDAPESGVLLQASSVGSAAQASFNGVHLQFNGTVFLSAQVEGEFVIHNLEGEARLLVDGFPTNMRPWTTSEVLMDASFSPAAAPSPPQPFPPDMTNTLERLPFELLARDLSPLFVPAEKIDMSEAALCPGMVQEAYGQAAMLCQNLDVDTVCIGNVGQGMLRAIPSAAAGSFSFAQPGDRVSLSQIERLSTNVSDDAQGTWSTAIFQFAVDSPSGAEASATMILVGEVELSSKTETASQPAAEPVDDTTGYPAQIRVTGSISVRAEPRVDTEAISQLEDGTSVLALDKSLDQQWIRILTLDGLSGWVVKDFVQMASGIESLPVYSPTRPADRETDTDGIVARAGLSAFDFVSRDIYPNCGDAPPSGLLLQSPAELGGAVTLRVNGVRLELNGTAFLTASEDALTLYSLEGTSSLLVPGTDIFLVAGQKMSLPLAQGGVAEGAVAMSEGHTAEEGMRLAALPLRLLPRGIDSVQADAEATVMPTNEPVQAAEEVEIEVSAAEPAPEPMNVEISVMPAQEQEACMISAGGLARNIREGPGTDYRAVDVLRAGQTVGGNTQKRGTHGLYWYHTDRGWIRFDAGEITGSCDSLPLHQEVIQAESQSTEEYIPPLMSELYGDICAAGGVNLIATVRGSGSRYYEFGGLWVGQEGTRATFSAHAPYFHKSFGNVITFTHPDGNLWLGSEAGKTFTINFAAEINFRVRVSGLVGDRVSLNVRCG